MSNDRNMYVKPRTLLEAIQVTQEAISLNMALFNEPRKKPRRDIAPLAFVQRLPSEYDSDDLNWIYVQTMREHPRLSDPRRFLDYHPTCVRFKPITETPTGEVFFLVKWHVIDMFTIPLFEEFCKHTKRKFGLYNPADGSVTGLPELSLKKCRLISTKELRALSPPPVEPEVDILERARSLLVKRSPQYHDIKVWDFKDDEEAHDRKLQQSYRETSLKVAQEYEAQLTEVYGEPIKTNAKILKQVPVGGKFHCVIWQVKSKKLYLAVDWADVGLPFVIVLGTIIDKKD